MCRRWISIATPTKQVVTNVCNHMYTLYAVMGCNGAALDEEEDEEEEEEEEKEKKEEEKVEEEEE